MAAISGVYTDGTITHKQASCMLRECASPQLVSVIGTRVSDLTKTEHLIVDAEYLSKGGDLEHTTILVSNVKFLFVDVREGLADFSSDRSMSGRPTGKPQHHAIVRFLEHDTTKGRPRKRIIEWLDRKVSYRKLRDFTKDHEFCFS